MECSFASWNRVLTVLSNGLASIVIDMDEHPPTSFTAETFGLACLGCAHLPLPWYHITSLKTFQFGRLLEYGSVWSIYYILRRMSHLFYTVCQTGSSAQYYESDACVYMCVFLLCVYVYSIVYGIVCMVLCVRVCECV